MLSIYTGHLLAIEHFRHMTLLSNTMATDVQLVVLQSMDQQNDAMKTLYRNSGQGSMSYFSLPGSSVYGCGRVQSALLGV